MSEPESTVNAFRADPYKNFRFRVKWDGRYVAGVSKVSGLSRTPEAIREAGDPSAPRQLPGQSSYAAITLERGVTYDADFARWANKVWDYTNSSSTDPQNLLSLADFHKSITIELYDEAGQLVSAYNVYRCWVSEYQALADLDNANAVAIQTLKLENEGWERDLAVPEPQETRFTDPPLA